MSYTEAAEEDVEFLTLSPPVQGVSLRLSQPLTLSSEKNVERGNLLSLSGDWVVAGTDSGFTVHSLKMLYSTLSSSEPHTTPSPPAHLVVPSPSPSGSLITQLAFSTAAESPSSEPSPTLVVACADGSLGLYRLSSLVNKDPTPYHTSPPSSTGNTVTSILPCPSPSSPLVLLLNSVVAPTLLTLAQSPSFATPFPSNSQTTTASWSVKGKQVVLGYANGEIGQYTPEGVQKGSISMPSSLSDSEGGMGEESGGGWEVRSLSWLENSVFLVVYAKREQEGEERKHEDEIFLVTKGTEGIEYMRMEDPTPAFGMMERKGQRWVTRLAAWTPFKHLLFVANSPSTDVGVVGQLSSPSEPSSAPHWATLTLPDASRPSLPLTPEGTDTCPLGLQVATEDGVRLLVYTSEGVLVVWKVENELGGAYTTRSASASAAATPAPTTTSAFGSTTPSAFGTPSLPASASPFGAPAFASATSASPFGAPAFGSAKPTGGFGGSPAFGAPAAFGSPSAFGAPSAFGSPAFGAPAASTPPASATPSSTTSAFSAFGTKPATFGSTASSTGGFAGFGSAPAATTASLTSSTPATPTPSAFSAFGTAPTSFGAATAFPTSTPPPAGGASPFGSGSSFGSAPVFGNSTTSTSPAFGSSTSSTSPSTAFGFGGTTTTPSTSSPLAATSAFGASGFAKFGAPSSSPLGSHKPTFSSRLARDSSDNEEEDEIEADEDDDEVRRVDEPPDLEPTVSGLDIADTMRGAPSSADKLKGRVGGNVEGLGNGFGGMNILGQAKATSPVATPSSPPAAATPPAVKPAGLFAQPPAAATSNPFNLTPKPAPSSLAPTPPLTPTAPAVTTPKVPSPAPAPAPKLPSPVTPTFSAPVESKPPPVAKPHEEIVKVESPPPKDNVKSTNSTLPSPFAPKAEEAKPSILGPPSTQSSAQAKTAPSFVSFAGFGKEETKPATVSSPAATNSPFSFAQSTTSTSSFPATNPTPAFPSTKPATPATTSLPFGAAPTSVPATTNFGTPATNTITSIAPPLSAPLSFTAKKEEAPPKPASPFTSFTAPQVTKASSPGPLAPATATAFSFGPPKTSTPAPASTPPIASVPVPAAPKPATSTFSFADRLGPAPTSQPPAVVKPTPVSLAGGFNGFNQPLPAEKAATKDSAAALAPKAPFSFASTPSPVSMTSFAPPPKTVPFSAPTAAPMAAPRALASSPAAPTPAFPAPSRNGPVSQASIPKLGDRLSATSIPTVSEGGMSGEFLKAFLVLQNEFELLRENTKLCKTFIQDVKQPRQTTGSSSYDGRDWSMGDLVKLSTLSNSLTPSVGSVVDVAQKQKRQAAELQSQLLKAETKREEAARFIRAQSDPVFAKMVRVRQLGPEQVENQKKIRIAVETVRSRVEQVEEHLLAVKNKVSEERLGRSGFKAPSLDSVNRAVRNITAALAEKNFEIDDLNLRLDALRVGPSSPAASSRRQRSPSVELSLSKTTGRHSTPKAASTGEVSKQAGPLQMNRDVIRAALQAVRQEPLVTTPKSTSRPGQPLSDLQLAFSSGPITGDRLPRPRRPALPVVEPTSAPPSQPIAATTPSLFSRLSSTPTQASMNTAVPSPAGFAAPPPMSFAPPPSTSFAPAPSMTFSAPPNAAAPTMPSWSIATPPPAPVAGGFPVFKAPTSISFGAPMSFTPTSTGSSARGSGSKSSRQHTGAVQLRAGGEATPPPASKFDWGPLPANIAAPSRGLSSPSGFGTPTLSPLSPAPKPAPVKPSFALPAQETVARIPDEKPDLQKTEDSDGEEYDEEGEEEGEGEEYDEEWDEEGDYDEETGEFEGEEADGDLEGLDAISEAEEEE